MKRLWQWRLRRRLIRELVGIHGWTVGAARAYARTVNLVEYEESLDCEPES